MTKFSDTDVYLNFAQGSSSPIVETHPTKWDKYTCGRTLYWKVSDSGGVVSPIQSTTIVCPTPTPPNLAASGTGYRCQSDRIIDFMKSLDNPFVFCGDFNLLPNTQSLKKLEDFGLRNLIKDYKISSTRSSFYSKPEKFADYALTSRGITVKNFRVLSDEVSDHLPLYLEFA